MSEAKDDGQSDHEIGAMQKVGLALEPLDGFARKRVLEWAEARFVGPLHDDSILLMLAQELVKTETARREAEAKVLVSGPPADTKDAA